MVVPLIVPEGPSTPSGTSHSKVHLPGKYSSKLKGGCSSVTFVGRPRSSTWLLGSGGLACCAASGGMDTTAHTTAAAARIHVGFMGRNVAWRLGVCTGGNMRAGRSLAGGQAPLQFVTMFIMTLRSRFRGTSVCAESNSAHASRNRCTRVARQPSRPVAAIPGSKPRDRLDAAKSGSDVQRLLQDRVGHLRLALPLLADPVHLPPVEVEIVDVALQRHERANGCGPLRLGQDPDGQR